MVYTQCPPCGRVLIDKELMNESQAVDKHQKAMPECWKNPVIPASPFTPQSEGGGNRPPATLGTSTLEEAIRRARGV